MTGSLGGSEVDVVDHGAETVISVRGELDAVAAGAVYDAAQAALVHRDHQDVEIDLRAMHTWTQGGLRRLAACTGLGIRVRMGPSIVAAP